VVLLGASNLSLSLGVVLALARPGPGPGAVFVAAGHGRAYGTWSRAGLRGLPAIVDCDLWPAARGGPGPTRALVTDVGNDLAYGATPAALAGWVRTCLDRLAAMEAEVVLTLLPTPTLARLAPWQFALFRTVLFPTCRLPLRLLLERATEVNQRLAELAARYRATLMAPDAAWYGADPIHVRRDRRAGAWSAILAGWGPPPAPHRPVSCRGLAPAWRTLAGIPVRRSQPSGRLPDGTPISLY
jgi:hypothetical protein